MFLGPFLCDLIRRRPEAVSAVVVAGRRSAGERKATLWQRLASLLTFWLIFEPREFLRAAWRRTRARMLGPRDPFSVVGTAMALGIPVVRLAEPKAAAVGEALSTLKADLVLNQSEILLGPDVLSIPPHGFLNRHASLLPSHRGRLASFWAHAASEPRHGITIHIVDEGIDTGPIVEQWTCEDCDPAWSFPRVLRHLNARAPELFWSAVDRLGRGEAPVPQPPAHDKAHRFPTLSEAQAYRARLSRRRTLAGRG